MLVDALGKPCPMPVVLAKKAMSSLPIGVGEAQILVDNRIACENLAKLAAGMGYGYSCEEQGPERFMVTLSAGESSAESVSAPRAYARDGEPPRNDLVVAVGRDSMGAGSEELGRILIKGFIYSLTQMTPMPKTVLFFNSGVKLATDGANTIADLRTLETGGTRVLLCGTCVNYYGLGDRTAVGEVTDMYHIVEELSRASSVINI